MNRATARRQRAMRLRTFGMHGRRYPLASIRLWLIAPAVDGGGGGAQLDFPTYGGSGRDRAEGLHLRATAEIEGHSGRPSADKGDAPRLTLATYYQSDREGGVSTGTHRTFAFPTEQDRDDAAAAIRRHFENAEGSTFGTGDAARRIVTGDRLRAYRDELARREDREAWEWEAWRSRRAVEESRRRVGGYPVPTGEDLERFAEGLRAGRGKAEAGR